VHFDDLEEGFAAARNASFLVSSSIGEQAEHQSASAAPYLEGLRIHCAKRHGSYVAYSGSSRSSTLLMASKCRRPCSNAS
jgi:hypothetical protein